MDYDDISMWVLSRIAPQVVKLLVHIIKLSFSTGIFPSNMKIERLFHCLKMEISQTSLTIIQFHFHHSSRRYWKKLFNERLQQFLNTKNNILSNSQYGFMAHMSTVNAAL